MIKSYRPGWKQQPTQAQLNALRSNHEHRITVRATDPNRIRPATPDSRVPRYGSDEDDM